MEIDKDFNYNLILVIKEKPHSLIIKEFKQLIIQMKKI